MYLLGMEGLVIEYKKFASLYCGVPIILTTGRAGLFIWWTLINPYCFPGLLSVGMRACNINTTVLKLQITWKINL